MAVFIARALTGGDSNIPTPPAVAQFTDVPTNYWAYTHVEYLYSNHIVGGYTPTTYQPTTDVTRDQMAVFISRSMVTPLGDGGLASYTPPTTATFPDVATGQWAFKYIEYLHGQGIVGGYADGYHPGDNVTRDQMAVFVQRAFKLAD